MIEILESYKKEMLEYKITAGDAYLIAVNTVGCLCNDVLTNNLSCQSFQHLLKSLMNLDCKTDSDIKIEQIAYVIDQVGNKKPAFDMISHIVDKINSVGLHDASGLHTLVYSYLAQCANFYNFSLKECLK
jgi:hypothetical protein